MSYHRYNRDALARVEVHINRWRNGEQVNGQAGHEISAFINNVSTDRWNKHFGQQRDWVDTRTIRESVPMAFIDYLLMRRSVRTRDYCPTSNRTQFSCPLTLEPRWHSIPSTLHTFRLQFPRVMTVLIANHVGVTLLDEWQPRNIYYMVQLPIYHELHRAMVHARLQAKRLDVPLYADAQDQLLLHSTLAHINRDKPYHVADILSNPRMYSRTTVRRAHVVNACYDILHSRVHSHHDALTSCLT